MATSIYSLAALLGSMPLADVLTRSEGLASEEWLTRALGGSDGTVIEDLGLATIEGPPDAPGWPARRFVVRRPSLGVGYPERVRRLSLSKDPDGEWVLMG